MSFHPSKCQVMHITTKKVMHHGTSYNIRGHQLELKAQSLKYLAVTISQDLTWREHINNITSKANGTLALLQRNISHCPKTLKAQSYKTLVRPQLEYCSPIWDPHHKKNIQKIEAVQNRAARYVNNDYSQHSSVTTMKEGMGWESLEDLQSGFPLHNSQHLGRCQIRSPPLSTSAVKIHPTILSHSGLTAIICS